MTGNAATNESNPLKAIGSALRDAGTLMGARSTFLQSSLFLDDIEDTADPLEAVASAVSGKSFDKLTEEDFGQAVGFLKAAADIKNAEDSRKEREEFELIQPSGKRVVLPTFKHEDALQWVIARLEELVDLYSVKRDEVKSIVVQAICSPTFQAGKITLVDRTEQPESMVDCTDDSNAVTDRQTFDSKEAEVSPDADCT